MSMLFTTAAAALWLGILTSISPCPLATDIVAVSLKFQHGRVDMNANSRMCLV